MSGGRKVQRKGIIWFPCLAIVTGLALICPVWTGSAVAQEKKTAKPDFVGENLAKETPEENFIVNNQNLWLWHGLAPRFKRCSSYQTP